MRTQSTRKATSNLSSPELYIRLTSLEMERARRAMERDRLLERIRIIDERLSKIAQEQAEMKQRIELTQQDPNASHPTDAPMRHPTTREEGRESQFGFTY